MLSVNTNYNTNYNIRFKAAAPKPPVHKRMLAGYENFERKHGSRFKDFLADSFWDGWEGPGGMVTGSLLFLGAFLGFLGGCVRSLETAPKRVKVEDTQEYIQQYKDATELYNERSFISGEYEARLNKLLPIYDSLIQDTKDKMDNVIQMRILRSETEFPKDSVTGKYSYTISLKDGKAYVDVKTE